MVGTVDAAVAVAVPVEGAGGAVVIFVEIFVNPLGGASVEFVVFFLVSSSINKTLPANGQVAKGNK